MRGFTLVAFALFSGCVTVPRPSPPTAAPPPAEVSLSNADEATAQAAAHYLAGLLYEGEQGRASSQALDEFIAAAKLDPERSLLHGKVSDLALFQHRPRQAIESLTLLCATDPTNANARADLAAAYLLDQRVDEAIEAYNEAIAIDPSRTLGHWDLARLLFALDRDPEAFEVLRSGFRRAEAPVVLAAFLNAVGAELVRTRNMARALAVYEFLSRESPAQRREFLNLLGDLYEADGKTADAMAAFERGTLESDPLPAAFAKLALLQQSALGDDAAVKTLTSAMNRFPEETSIAFLLAYLHVKAGRFAEAIPVFEALIRQAPAQDAQAGDAPPPVMSEDFYLLFAHACEKNGDSARAEQIMEECLRRHPESHEALNYLAYTWAERNTRLEEALDFVTRALDAEPDNGAYLDTLGWVYYRLGRFDEARAQIERAIGILGEDAVLADHLGDVHAALGNAAEALRFWRLSHGAEPSDAVLKKIQTAEGATAAGPAAAIEPPPEPASEPPRPVLDPPDPALK